MAFDHENHTIDAAGFQRHKESGHLIGIESAPARAAGAGAEYPKWVVPHPAHLHRHPLTRHVSTPHFVQHHIDRNTGEVSVLVHDEEQERLALADPNQQSAA